VEGLREAKRNLGQDMNPGLPEYEKSVTHSTMTFSQCFIGLYNAYMSTEHFTVTVLQLTQDKITTFYKITVLSLELQSISTRLKENYII
jgi:hypothetical protein